jgi:hypothetical protein
MNMMFSKEGAVRFSFVVVAESAAIIPLYTLLVPLKKPWSISSVLGTLPSSSRRATAILALRSFFFCSVVAIHYKGYQNSMRLSSYET